MTGVQTCALPILLSRFSKGEQELMDEAFQEAAQAVVMMLGEGADRAMNHFNTKKKEVG